MIGLYLNWHDQGLAPDLSQRFANSFGVGTSVQFGRLDLTRGMLVATCLDRVQARVWKPETTPRGEQLLFDGYICNRSELRAELGNHLRTDSALYSAGYSAWGETIDLRAIGSFGVIIVSPDERSVRIVRSPLDAPPLHIWHDQHRTIVASTPRAVFATGEISPQVDEQKIADSLLLNYQEGDRGWYKDVARLRTGHRGLLTPMSYRTKSYYEVRNLPDVRLKSDQDYVDAANALLTEGTRTMLDGFNRPAISLSGGLDSQAVAALAMKNMGEGQRLLGLTSIPEKGWDGAVPEGRFGDESGHVKAFAALYPKLDVEWIDAQGLSFDHKLQAMFLTSSIAPRNASNLHWLHEIWSRAKGRNCDVVLTGSMGNATFSFDGEGMLPDLFRKGRWLKLLRLFSHTQPSWTMLREIAGKVGLAFAPDHLAKSIKRVRHGSLSGPLDSWSPLNKQYAGQMNVFERAKSQAYDVLYRPFRSTKAIREIMFGNPMHEAGDFMLGFEQIHGIPSRDPTFYRPLVEFCYAIPDDQYWRKGERRWLARRMLAGVVPEMVLKERRRGLQNADWEARLRRESPYLRAELDRLGQDPEMAGRLDIAGLSYIMDKWMGGASLDQHQYQRLQLALPRALTTARFIRFVEGRNSG